MIHDYNDEHIKNSKPPLAGEGMRKNLYTNEFITNHERPLDRFLDSIISNGGTVKGSGAQRMCTCPAHDDHSPSLSVREGDDGRVLLKCHAGCTTESILQTLGLSMRDLYPHDTTATVSNRINGHQNQQSVSDSAGRAPSEGGFDDLTDAMRVYAKSLGVHDHRWDYHDAQGNLVGVILRWETVKGKQVLPISLIDGRWQLKGMVSPCPLYQLPSILNSDGPVIVCEGEKAADAAIACGFVATTSPHGSKSASKADWSVLDDRDVVIVPDLDDAGDAYALEVTELCDRAASIRIVDLSEVWEDLQLGADLADVLVHEAGDVFAVRSKLDPLIERTPPEQSLGNSEQTAINHLAAHQPIPVESFPEPVRSYIVQGAEAIGCDPSYIALPMLSMLAGAIGNTHEVEASPTWIEPCVIWSCIVGKSGTCKSPAIRYAFKPLEQIQNGLFYEYQQELAVHKAEQSKVGIGSVPRPQRCIINDATIEATLQCIQENPHGLVMLRDELAGWFDFDRYSSGKRVGASAGWIELFHAKHVSVDRRTAEPIVVPRASLSIAGGIQPGILARVMDRKNLDSGLVARFLFASPDSPSKVLTDAAVDPKTIEQMNTLVQRLYEHSMCTVSPDASIKQPMPHLIRLDSHAIAAFRDFVKVHNHALKFESDHVAAAWSKLECYVLRIALVFHLVREAAGDASLEDPEQIGVDTLLAAMELVEWFKNETKRLYTLNEMNDNDRETLRVINWIDKQGGSVTHREFYRGLSKYNSSSVAKQKLDELVDAGIGFYRGRKPTGRSQEFVLHTEYQSIPNTTVTDTFAPQAAKKAHIDSGASGRYPVQSTKKDQ